MWRGCNRIALIGVMPSEFRDFFNRDAEIWAPLVFRPDGRITTPLVADMPAVGKTDEKGDLYARVEAQLPPER